MSWRFPVTAATLLAAFVAAACGDDRTPTSPTPDPPAGPPPPVSTGPIAFTSDRDDLAGSVYLANEDGSSVTRLVAGTDPSWEPGGRRLALIRADGVYVVNADGSGVSHVWRSGASRAWGRPAWSPDGTRIAFTEVWVTTGGILVMRADGSELSQLVSHRFTGFENCIGPDGSCGVSSPAWSPDGRRIAFEAFALDQFESGIYVMNDDGSAPRLLVPWASSPAWSPDGASLAFQSNGAIGVVNADGSGRRTFSPIDAAGLQWTPDGRIVFVAVTSAGTRLFATDGGGVPRQVIPSVVVPERSRYSDWGVSWAR